jgi:hypothetical protein
MTKSTPIPARTSTDTSLKEPGFPGRARILPDRGALTRQPLRWLLPWLIIWVLCGVALASWPVLLDRVDLQGRMMAPTAQARVEFAVERAFSGRGLDERTLATLRAPQARTNPPRVVPAFFPGETAMRVDGSSFHFNLGALDATVKRSSELTGTVSWRHAQPAGGATQFWVCGYAQPPAGAILSEPQNLTSVAPELLPSTCRASR